MATTISPAVIPLAWSQRSPTQRRTLIAAGLGWMLDAFDVMLYSVVLATLIEHFGMSRGVAGWLNTLTLIASAVGGVLFGALADRFGRARMLSVSVLTYSLFSFACGLATSIGQLALFRFLLGLGMGGEWNTGAALVGETWPAALRGRALAIMQSAWGIGYALAAATAAIVLPHASWRAVFFIGVAPALLVFWIRRHVQEPELFVHRRSAVGSTVQRLTHCRRPLLLMLGMDTFAMFGWWGVFNWLPAYLQLPPSRSGLGFNPTTSAIFMITLNVAGMVPGYLTFGWLADHYGRRRVIIGYLVAAAALVPAFAAARTGWLLLPAVSLVAFFGTGFFAGSAILGCELFPTPVRAAALGIVYNVARALGAAAPWAVGLVSERAGLSRAFLLCAAAFGIAALWAWCLPESYGWELE